MLVFGGNAAVVWVMMLLAPVKVPPGPNRRSLRLPLESALLARIVLLSVSFPPDK